MKLRTTEEHGRPKRGIRSEYGKLKTIRRKAKRKGRKGPFTFARYDAVGGAIRFVKRLNEVVWDGKSDAEAEGTLVGSGRINFKDLGLHKYIITLESVLVRDKALLSPILRSLFDELKPH
ncbi:hypothetical protein PIB30_036080 [Stylosanthes scabra]|uniref:Uncharacterized protein n=1 Tax=Stylosanthes scabra TaxID=79078 RepID=A0ABU6SDH8_9FABA|nr:hypothetical protein [Stylosanthes scabra]